MTSRERIINCLNGKRTDRIPISTYEIVCFNFWDNSKIYKPTEYETLGFDFKSWYHRQASYAPLLKLIREKTDCFYMWSDDGGKGVSKFLNGFDVPQKVIGEKRGNSTYNTTTIFTPKGELRMSARSDENINTVWETEHLIKSLDDIEKMLSIPYEKFEPDINSFVNSNQLLGENGIMMPNIGDPLLYVAELFGFTNFVLFAFEEPDLVEKLLDIFHERVMDYLNYLLRNGVGGVFRIVGPEYATPPYLSPDHFRRYVCGYDRDMVDAIHKAGSHARIHSHGRIGAVLEDIAAMHPDAIDPIEAIPSGDITMAQAKDRIGSEVTLMGNIQFKDIELLTTKEIIDLTKRTIDEGAVNGRFVLLPTASPITEPIPGRANDNLVAMIETAFEYGRYM